MYNINGITYHIVDSIERISSKDSFTHQNNKLGAGAGAWEWHIGSKTDLGLYSFFNGREFNVKCFLKKSDMIWLMDNLKNEYLFPSQNYRDRLRFNELWQERVDEINALNEYNFFDFREHDGRDPGDNRLYAKRPGNDAEGDTIYGLMRELILPNMTYISILKLQSDTGELLYYFKIFPLNENSNIVNESTNQMVRTIKSDNTITATERAQLIKSRIGQGKFRLELLENCGTCPITQINDPQLLIASHIKPWSVSTNIERLDVYNGLMFTPTFDKLFDNGLISFEDNKRILISPWMSNSTVVKLNIIQNQEITLLPVVGREHFLLYHRENIFKK